MIIGSLTRLAKQEVSNGGIAKAYLSQWGLPPIIGKRIGLKLSRAIPQHSVGIPSLFANVEGYDMTNTGCVENNLSLVIEALRKKISQEYSAGHILNCDGWLLSKSEAQLYVLSYTKG